MEPLDIVIMASVFGGVVAFAYIGVNLFSQGWDDYESQYIEGSEGDLESALLTIPPQHLLYLCMLSGFFAFAGVYFFLGSPFGAFLMSIFALFIPKMGLNIYKTKRQKKFGVQLVDALTSLSNSLRAGYALPKAIEGLADEAPNPMGQEMRIVLQEMRMGDTVEQALRKLLARMPNEDLDLVITAIAISSELGGNLTDVFERISETIRARQEIEGKIDSLTSQGKAQGLVVGLLPIILGLAINTLDPKLFEPMYTTWIGWILIAVVILLEIIGLLIIRKIIAIRV